MLVRTLTEHQVNKATKAEGEVYDLADGAVADAVERKLVQVLPRAELKELAAAAVEAGVAGDPRDLQGAAAAGLEAEESAGAKKAKGRR